MRKLIGSTVCGVLLFSGLSGVFGGTALAAVSCPGSFNGTVADGPDDGFVVAGSLSVSVDDHGTVTGQLDRDDGSTVPISGRVEGRSIHVIFDLGDTLLRGVGSLVGADFTTCMGTTEGVFSGPAKSDHGNWGIIWGS